MIRTTLSQWSVVLLSVYTTESQTPHDETVGYLWGKETLVISTCFSWLSFFISTKTRKRRAIANKEPAQEFKSTAVLPYIKGVSEVLRCCLQHKGIRTIFKTDITLRSHLVRPKDALEPSKQNGVVYKIPCECGDVYIGETGRSMRERIMEHDRDIRFARTQTSVGGWALTALDNDFTCLKRSKN